MKEFRTSDLKGEMVVVVSKVPGLKFSGILLEYFESNGSIVLKDYTIHRMKRGKWYVEETGDIIFIKGDAYAEIICPKFSKK